MNPQNFAVQNLKEIIPNRLVRIVTLSNQVISSRRRLPSCQGMRRSRRQLPGERLLREEATVSQCQPNEKFRKKLRVWTTDKSLVHPVATNLKRRQKSEQKEESSQCIPPASALFLDVIICIMHLLDILIIKDYYLWYYSPNANLVQFTPKYLR